MRVKKKKRKRKRFIGQHTVRKITGDDENHANEPQRERVMRREDQWAKQRHQMNAGRKLRGWKCVKAKGYMDEGKGIR